MEDQVGPVRVVGELVGFLPPPGQQGFLTLPQEQAGAEAWLRQAVEQL